MIRPSSAIDCIRDRNFKEIATEFRNLTNGSPPIEIIPINDIIDDYIKEIKDNNSEGIIVDDLDLVSAGTGAIFSYLSRASGAIESAAMSLNQGDPKSALPSLYHGSLFLSRAYLGVWGVFLTWHIGDHQKTSILVDLFPQFGKEVHSKKFHKNYKSIATPVRLVGCNGNWQHKHVVDALNRMHAVGTADFFSTGLKFAYEKLSKGRNDYVYAFDGFPFEYLGGRKFCIDEKLFNTAGLKTPVDDEKFTDLLNFTNKLLRLVFSALDDFGGGPGSLSEYWAEALLIGTNGHQMTQAMSALPAVMCRPSQLIAPT